MKYNLMIFSLLFAGLELYAQGKSLEYHQDCEVANFAFNVNEELIYKIYYNLDFIWIPAGELVFRVKGDSTTFTISAEGSTYPSYEWFYKVDDKYKTVLNRSTLQTISAEKTLQEGGYKLYENVTYDYSDYHAHVTRGKDKETSTDRGRFPFKECSTDLLGLLYRLRNIDKDAFAEAGSLPINFFLDKKEYNINMRYIKHGRKRIRGQGRIDAIMVSPELIAGKVFKEGDVLTAWVSDDMNRVPLMIKSPLTIGSVRAVLKSYRGLKYPLGG